jgi:dTDP-4-dehydrorhamnose reductase
MRIPILGTGLSGLVGSRIVELLENKYEFIDLSLKTSIDITQSDQVLPVFQKSPAKVVVHMAAKTDVDSCEDDKILGEEGLAWRVNVIGTQNIVEAACETNKRVIYISTDFVFDGTKEYYTEDDEPNPVNWYGFTKYEGERTLVDSDISYCIVRLAYPYRAHFSEKADFVRRIIEKAKKQEKIMSLTDHTITPTFIDDIAMALDLLLEKEVTGIFHVVGSQFVTPYEAVEKILETFKLEGDNQPILREKYFQDRAFRPCRLALKNDKIIKLGADMRRFDDGLREMRKQLTKLR